MADNIKLIFSMSNVNIIVDTKVQPNNNLCIVQSMEVDDQNLER